MTLLAKLILATAFSSVALHAVFIGLSFPIAAALAAPLHALCCLLALLLQQSSHHQGAPALRDALRSTSAPADKAVHVAAAWQAVAASPPQSFWHILAVAAAAVQDSCGWLGVWGWMAPELPQLVCGTASVMFFLVAAWPDGALATLQARAIAWAAGALLAAHLAAADDPEAVGAPALAAVYDLSCCGLAAQSACALLLAPAGRRRAAASRGGYDRRRLRLQLCGALCLVGSIALRLRLGRVARGGALAVGAERAARSALALSGWLLEHAPNPEPLSGDDTDGEAEPAHDLDGRRQANRRRREARAAREPPPLLLDSWGMQGGVQGHEWADVSLVDDQDGDEAHEFWEASPGGAFKRVVPGSDR
mmetsp:Transcript_33267/g.107604  ORF Transcript_33267/g.107604 Transcript_33267/m.107604 type:complete len:364 (-) Transcript_33267:169-1260(-)